MRNISKPWVRPCPDCNTTFASVQPTGICPSCSLVFDAAPDGTFVRRRHRLGDPPPPTLSPTEAGVKHVRKLIRFLNAEKITRDEINFNLMLYFVRLPRECWSDCAAEFSAEHTTQFVQYLDSYLNPVDHMPSPTCFMVGPFDPERIRLKKLELRPVYREIHEFWRHQT